MTAFRKVRCAHCAARRVSSAARSRCPRTSHPASPCGRAFSAARDESSDANLHEWRKQVKYLWRQLQTLEPIEPAAVGLLVEKAHQLGDWLGDDHDLAFLRDKLRELPARTLGQAARDALNGLIDRRRTALQSQAEDLGRSLYQEKPKGLVRRLRDHWRAWRAGSA